MLGDQFLPVDVFRNISLKCLIEVASLNVGTAYDNHFAQIITYFLESLGGFLPIGIGSTSGTHFLLCILIFDIL